LLESSSLILLALPLVFALGLAYSAFPGQE
jgi:hypothetical protein